MGQLIAPITAYWPRRRIAVVANEATPITRLRVI
jgi:hypothetical protein